MQQSLEFILEKQPFYGLALRVKQDGKLCSPYSSDLSEDIRSLLRLSLSQKDNSQQLEQWLLKQDSISLELKINQKYVACDWDANFFYERRLSLNLDGDKVFFSDKGYQSNIVLLSNRFFADLTQLKLGRVEEGCEEKKSVIEEGLAKAKKEKLISESLSGLLNQKKSLTVAKFNQANLLLPNEEELSHYFFHNHNATQTPELKEYELQTNIRYREDDLWIKFKLNYLHQENEEEAALQLQSQEIESLVALGLHPKRSRSLMQFIVKAVQDDNKDDLIERYLTAIGPEEEFINHLKDVLRHIDHSDIQLRIIDGHWVAKKVYRKQEQLLWIMIGLCFANNLQYSSNDGAVLLPRDAFFANFQHFESVLNRFDIKLNFTDKEFRLIEHDIHIELDESVDEQLPKIFLDNQLIGFEDFEKVSTNIWQEISASEHAVIHPDTLKRVKQVLQLVNFQKKEKKTSVFDTAISEHFHLLDWIQLRKAGIRITLTAEQEQMIQDFMSFKSLKKIDKPKGLIADPREYQKDSLNWFTFLYEHRLGAILADDMGLGKTFQAIQFLAAAHEGLIKKHSDGPFLIVMPPSLLYNWENELKRFYPDFKQSAYVGTERYLDNDSDVILTTYEIVRRDVDSLSQVTFDTIIFDESQFIKNNQSARSTASRELKANFKMCLTGTPMENHIGEYVSMLDLVLPGFSKSLDLFEEEDNGTDVLLKRSKIFVLRRLKSELLQELPKKTEDSIFLSMSESQEQYYKGLLKSVRDQVKSLKDQQQKNSQFMILTLLMRLRQVCLSPALIDEDYKELTPKYDFLINKLITLHDEGYSALVFTQFSISLDIIEGLCKKENIKCYRLDGKTPNKKRQALIDDFQNSEEPAVFIMSLKAGGFGLNLTKANYVFHVDPWWNPAVENQATDRTHRIGQEQPVFSYKLIMHESIEEKMLSIKEHKSQLFDTLFTNSEIVQRKESLNMADINYLLNN